MIELRNEDTGELLGNITEKQLQFLIDQLEEEDSEDTDYYINPATVEMFEQNGADPQLIEILREALLGHPDLEVRWTRK